MRPVPLTIAAGASVDVYEQGTQIYLRSTTGPVDISGSVATSSGSGFVLTNLREGEGQRGIPFDALKVKNNSASSITLELVVSFDSFFSTRAAIDGAVGVSDSITEDTDTFGTTPTTIAAIASQVRLSFRCDPANSGVIYVAGVPYEASEGNTIETSADVSVVASAAGQVLWWNHEALS